MWVFQGILQGQEWSTKEFQDEAETGGNGNSFIIFKLENTSGDS